MVFFAGPGVVIPDTHGTVLRAMRVEFPGAIYHVMDRGDAGKTVS